MKATSGLATFPKDSNSLMVLTFLFVGAVFLFLLTVVNYIAGLGLDNVAGGWFLQGDFSPAYKLGFIVATYGLGYILYCASLPLIGTPAEFLLQVLEVNLLVDEALHTVMGPSWSPEHLQKLPRAYRCGIAYLYIRKQNNTLSRDYKFLFNQVMFARSAILAAVTISIVVGFLKPGVISFVSIFLIYLISIPTYAATLVFWDRNLYGGLLLNQPPTRFRMPKNPPPNTADNDNCMASTKITPDHGTVQEGEQPKAKRLTKSSTKAPDKENNRQPSLF